MRRTWVLLGPDGQLLASARPGTLGGHRGTRIFGRLDCRAALQAIGRGGYVRQRVFFLNSTHARAAGYRPCAICLPKEYAAWKSTGKR
jgi:methylphosphotriester-DNA--protein-cysteine methyltransferase